MASPGAWRGIELYAQHPCWGKDYGDVLRFIDETVRQNDAVLVTEETDQRVYRRRGWQCFAVMELDDRFIATTKDCALSSAPL